MALFTPSDQVIDTSSLVSVEQDSFMSDVKGIGHLSLSFTYTKVSSNLTQNFSIPYWLKSGESKCQDGVWFCLSDLYNHLAKWLSQNNPTIARRGFWTLSHNWLTSSETRSILIGAIKDSPYSNDADKLSVKVMPSLSYAKLANLLPDLFVTTGKYKATKCYANEYIIEPFFFAWLSAKSGYPLYSWIKNELNSIDRSPIE